MTFRTLTAVAVTVVLGFVLVASASAGEYTIHDCPGSLQPNFDAGPWQSYGTASLPSSGGFQESCEPGGTLGAAIGWYGSEQSLNTNLGVKIQSPSSAITIHELRVVWSVAHQSSGSDTFAQLIAETGFEFISGTPFATGSSPTLAQFPAGTTTVYVFSYCSYDASTNCYFPSSTSPIFKAEGMDTTLQDTEQPTATVTGGALKGGGSVSGTATMQFTATDPSSGVREAQLIVDGNPVVTHSYSSQCPYTNFLACPQSKTDSMAWNTVETGNGEHVVALRVTDAAGNSQTFDEHSVQVANISGASPGPAGNGPAGAQQRQQTCTAAKGTQTTVGTSTEHGVLWTGYRQRAHLGGRLLGPARKPIASAIVEVLTRPNTTGSAFSLFGHVTTRAEGDFRLTLPPGVSRIVCLRYRPLGDGQYTAARTVALQVRAGVTLAVHPREVASNETIILTGNVLGGYISPAGKVVELQVLYLGQWRVFQTVRSQPDGQFTSFYTFIGGQGTFAFRARVRGENDYPYSLGYSHPAKVRAG